MARNKVSDIIQYLVTMLYDEQEIIDYKIIEDDETNNTGTLSLTFSDKTVFKLKIEQTK
jgi:hypothetical protein